MNEPVLKIKRASPDLQTGEGHFYPEVNGTPVGEGDRAFYRTKKEAQEVGERYIENVFDK